MFHISPAVSKLLRTLDTEGNTRSLLPKPLYETGLVALAVKKPERIFKGEGNFRRKLPKPNFVTLYYWGEGGDLSSAI
jgi:hypothetical protein